MTSKTFISKSALALALAAAGVTLLSAGAFGQAMEVVTVEAVRAITVGSSPIGAPVREMTIRSRVSYADLDLTKEAGVAALRKRVDDAAKSNCKEIVVDVPIGGSTVEKCIKEALDGAAPQIAKVIAEAKAAKK